MTITFAPLVIVAVLIVIRILAVRVTAWIELAQEPAMPPAARPLDWADILRMVRGWPYPPGWYPVLTIDFGGEWFVVHLGRGSDETVPAVMHLADATGLVVGAMLDRLVDEAVGMSGPGEPLTSEEIKNMGRWSR